jgi:hypothetical protein
METTEILKIFLPLEIVDNFDLVRVNDHDNSKGKEMHLFLDEKFQYPDGYSSESLESKGFLEPVNICDFPIQNKKVKLRLRKRRWVDKNNHKYISNSYDFKHKGTSYSKELASFLKEGVR